MAERSAGHEKASVWWKTRLFKIGLGLAVVGGLTGITEIAVVGVIAMGGAWSFWGGKK